MLKCHTIIVMPAARYYANPFCESIFHELEEAQKFPRGCFD